MTPADGPATSEDRDLVARLRSGDAAAYEAVVRAHSGRLLAVAFRLLRNSEDARDAVQEAFLSAFKAIDGFSGEARVSTWLHRIVVNCALMKIRGRSPEESIEDLLPTFQEDGHQAHPSREWPESSHRAV